MCCKAVAVVVAAAAAVVVVAAVCVVVRNRVTPVVYIVYSSMISRLQLRRCVGVCMGIDGCFG